MPRPSAEDRRLDYLEIGARMATHWGGDSATVDALADVKLVDVADRAGVTKGALYHIWPSQEAFRRDLLGRLLEQSRQAEIRELRLTLRAPDLPIDDPREILCRHADDVFDALKDDPAFFARFSFFVHAGEPEVARLLARGDDAVVADFSPFVHRYLELVDRRLRPPFTAELVLRAANALFQGLCLRYRTSPDLVDRRDAGAAHTVYADSLVALMEHFSEPDSDADEVDRAHDADGSAGAGARSSRAPPRTWRDMPRRPSAQVSDATRDRLLQVTVELLDEGGDHSLRLADVARRSGVAVSTIYAHFRDRTDLVAAARLVQFRARARESIEQAEAALDPGLSREDFVAAAQWPSLRSPDDPGATERRWDRLEAIADSRHLPELAARLTELQAGMSERVTAVIRRSQDLGLVDPELDAAAVAMFSQVVRLGLALWDVSGDARPDPAAWAAVIDRVYDAVLPPSATVDGASDSSTSSTASS